MVKIDHNICFIDFETTGSNLFIDDPIQIGAFFVDSNIKNKLEFESNIRPSKSAVNTQKAYQIHRIDIFELNEEPSANEVLSRYFKEIGTDYCFAGWNISFDVPFFRKICYENQFQKEFNSINYRHIDVQSICKILKYLGKVDKGLKSLTDFAEYFGISRSKRHRALEDAKITYQVFYKALQLLEEGQSVEKKNLFVQ